MVSGCRTTVDSAPWPGAFCGRTFALHCHCVRSARPRPHQMRCAYIVLPTTPPQASTGSHTRAHTTTRATSQFAAERFTRNIVRVVGETKSLARRTEQTIVCRPAGWLGDCKRLIYCIWCTHFRGVQYGADIYMYALVGRARTRLSVRCSRCALAKFIGDINTASRFRKLTKSCNGLAWRGVHGGYGPKPTLGMRAHVYKTVAWAALMISVVWCGVCVRCVAMFGRPQNAPQTLL